MTADQQTRAPAPADEDRRPWWKPDKPAAFAVVATALALPFLTNIGTINQAPPILASILITAGVYAISAIGLNVQFGYTGLLNFGHVAFMSVGAYTTVLLIPHEAGRLGGASGGTWPLIPAVIAGMAAAAALGALLGIPTVRLRGDYLAIVTIAVGEILRLALRTQVLEPVTGGVFGVIQFSNSLQDLRPAFITDIARALNIPTPRFWLLIVIWLLVALSLVVFRVLVESPWGRVLRSIREDEDAARALGKNAFWYKLQSLMVGGALGGLAGVMLAFSFGQTNPDTFLPLVTFFVWAILILGGSGSIIGPVAGAIIFWVIINQSDELLRSVLGALDVNVTGDITAAWRFIIVGAGIALLMIFRPQGLYGKREELLLEIK